MGRPLSFVVLMFLLVFCPIPTSRAQSPGSTAWINKQVANLTNPDVMVRKAARDALDRQASLAKTPAKYAGDLDAALTQLAKSRKVRDRIAAGAMAEQVAARFPSPALEGTAQALMANHSDATALLGVKVAKLLLPTTVTLPKDPLPAAVIACAKAHPESGQIAEEAYAALTLHAGHQNDQAPPAAAVAAAVPELVNLLETRIAAYGEHAPANPGADGAAAVFIGVEGWSAVANNPAMANRILRDLGDVLCVQARAVADGNTDRGLTEARRAAAGALQVTTSAPNGSPLKSAIEELAKPLDGVAPDEVDRRCAALGMAMPAAAKLTRARR